MQSTTDPRLTEAVRENLVRADQFSEESPVYDFLTGCGLTKPCEDDVVSELVKLHRRQARGWRLKIAAPRSSACKRK
jgi:hypothetical protein